MRKLIFTMLLFGTIVTLKAQDSQAFFDQMTQKYSETDGFSASMLTRDMFDLYLKKKDLDENSEEAAALKNLDNILVLSQSGYSVPFIVGQNFEKDDYKVRQEEQKKERGVIHKEILDHYKKGNYSLFKTEKRMGEDIKVYLKKNNGKISSLALVTNSNVSTNLIELDGDIDLSNVASLSKAMNLRGLENLYKLDNKSPYQGAYVPFFDEQRIEEMAARAKEMAERQAVLSDEQLKKIQEQAEFQAQRQIEMAERYREMNEKYRRQPIFLNYPGDSTIYYLDGKKVTVETIKELDKEAIKSVEINKPENEGGKTEIRISTK